MATSNDSIFSYAQNSIPIFNGESYDFWSIQMRTLFMSHDLWKLVDEGYEAAAATQEEITSWSAAKQTEFKNNRKKDAKALLFIQQGVSKAIFPRIMSAKTSKEAWEILRKQFQGYDKVISVKLQSLWKEFDNMQMKESETVSEFFSKVSTITNQIISYGDTLEDKKIVMKVLRSLPAKFEHVVAAIEVSKDLATLTLDELMGALEAHQERIQRFANQPIDQAFQAKMNISDKKEVTHQERNKRSSYNNQSSSRGRNENWRTRGRGKRYNFNNRNNNSKCIICNKTNHESRNCIFRCKRCKIPNHSQKDCWFQNRDQANFSEQDGDAQVTFSCMNTQLQQHHCWYIDSACSNHMPGIREQKHRWN